MNLIFVFRYSRYANF